MGANIQAGRQAGTELLTDGCIVPRSNTNKGWPPLLGIVN